MSTLRINNIEAKSVPASPTIDEKIKLTNSSGDVLVHVDGKTSGITTIGINTTDGNIKFDANSNIVVTGIITATKFVGAFEPTDLPVSGDLSIADKIIHIGDTNTAIRFPAADTITAETGGSERLRIGSEGNLALGGTNTSAYANQAHLFIGGVGNLYGDNGTGSGKSISLSNNAYINTSGNWVYRASDKATNIYQYDGTIGFRNAGSGTAGNTISWSERLRIDSSGKIGISRTPTQHPLEIQHGSEPTVSLWRGSTKGAALQAQSGGTYLYSYENAPLIFSVNSAQGFTERLRITSAGTAQFKGNIEADAGSSGMIDFGDITTAYGRLYADNSNGVLIGSKSNHNLTLRTNNTERIKIANSSAATSIGGSMVFNAMLTTQGDISGGLLMLKATENTNRLFVTGNDSSGCEINLYDDAGVQKGILGVASNEFFIKAPNAGAGLGFYTHNGSSIGARLSISANGNVSMPNGSVFSINKSSVTGNFHQEINYKAGQKGCIYLENHAYYSAQPPLRINNTDTNNVRAMEDVQFERAGALKGYIRISSGSVTYSTSGSDERLKKNFETWNEEVLPDFKTLSPKLFNWIDDDDGTDKIKGFVAQDNLDKFPEAYNLTTSTDRYYFNPSGMVHYLMKAMQEAAIKIETLEAEVAALKSS